MPKEEVFKNLIRSTHTFAIVAPQQYKTIADSIHGSNQNLAWYRDNNYPYIACQVTEYGIAYCQYSYSLPRVITELFHLYMQVNYTAFFKALGFQRLFYDAAANKFDQDEIIEEISTIQQRWKEKYPLLEMKTQNLRFDNLVNFNYSFTNEMELLNLDSK